jgi:hypothetical protein
LGFKLWQSHRVGRKSLIRIWRSAAAFLIVVFLGVNLKQAKDLSSTQSWHWKTYYDFVDCVDQRLSLFEKEMNLTTPFEVWFPTFPDVTIELSRRHPNWEFSRTNDFWDRRNLAIQHGQNVHAVIVTEAINPTERNISGDPMNYPEIKSTWMTWDGYFLKQLLQDSEWKTNRHLCQRGRWQAFLFMKKPIQTNHPNS